MKKFILILILAASASLTISSCTEDEVKPLKSGDNGGGGASEPILP